MSESPSSIAREAKNIHQGLKELLKAREPFDKEIDFQRKNLRRRYLNLLLVHPYAKESKDAENHLWMQTSYAFISAYKQRVAALDRAVQNNSRQQQPQSRHHGPVEYRKLLQRFRQFLADEERFWTQLVVRFRRSFALDEAQPALITLGILSVNNDGKVDEDPEVPSSNGRNHYQFPPEDPSVSVFPTTAAERESRVAILSKALICLGDIARYREQYNESGGRSKAGQDDAPGPGKRGRNRRGGAVSLEGIPRPRNYEKARLCYEQARLLVPHEGNPFHQLAILASYQKDPFASLVHYYRALCVRQPYDTASENMGTVLTKTLEQWKKKDHESRSPPAAAVPKIRIEAMKEKIVVLHALWRIGLEKVDSSARKLAQSIYTEFHSLVSDRHLPEDLISNIVVLSLSALWKRRMIRDPPSAGNSDSSSVLPALVIEARMFSHVLSLYRALLEVGIEQLQEPLPPDAAESDLAQRITAVFRRTLPALRIASKWLRANASYLVRGVQGLEQEASNAGFAGDGSVSDVYGITNESIGIAKFWVLYTDFMRTLARSFPVDRLPPLIGPLEEDVDMRGFLPLRKMMDYTGPTAQDTGAGKALPAADDQVHPNVLQLMRIAELLNDAKALVDMEGSPTPLAIYGNQFMIKGVEARPQRADGSMEPIILDTAKYQALGDPDDDMSEITSRTDDDVVRDAFRFLDNADRDTNDDEDGDDEIVYLRGPISPVIAPQTPGHRTPITPVKLLESPPALSPIRAQGPAAFTTPTMVTHVAPTTAQDLLNDVMGFKRPLGSEGRTKSPVTPPAILFGSEANRPGHSIWSAAQDEQDLRFSNSPSHNLLPQSRPYHPAPSQDAYQPNWAHASGNQTAQYSVNPPISLPHPHLVDGQQRALPSMTAAQLFPNHNSGQPHPDPYAYQAVHSFEVQPIGVPPQYLGEQPLDPRTGYYYGAPSPVHNLHSRHLSLHDSRPVGAPFAPSAMSQVWGNGG